MTGNHARLEHSVLIFVLGIVSFMMIAVGFLMVTVR